ncbi:hypothetical protein [Roseomonas sp. KE2513]|uniref:hypothetical protein n=1 Tax=Roseomonas sp. KE2513 TaxID=2479202 RepID=UPI0018DEF6D9|nr:hypothetical protein [Roseomonas sp. KE2513]
MRLMTVAFTVCASLWAGDLHAQMTPISRGVLSPELQQRIARLASRQQAVLSFEAPLLGQSQIAARLETDIELQAIQRAIAEELIGKGYDLWSGPMFTRCIVPQAITFRPVSSNGHNLHNVYNVRQIENISEYSEDRSSGVNASLTYKLLSFGGGTSEYAGSTFESTNKYIDIYIRYVGDEYAANQGSPTPAATAAVGAGHERFSKVCGQQFISRVGFGVSLDARLTAEVQINENSQSNKAEVSVGFRNLISFGADSASTVQTLGQYAEISSSVLANGGSQPKPEDLLDYARRFGETNPAAVSTQEIYIETTPYSEIAYRIFAKFDDVAMRATGIVLDLHDDRLAILQQRADLNTAINNPTFFTVDSETKSLAELTALRDLQSTYLDRLGELWAVCRAALDEPGIEKCRTAIPPNSVRPARLDIRLTGQAAAPPTSIGHSAPP